jgi:multiple sugar transport system substrate-binding protein
VSVTVRVYRDAARTAAAAASADPPDVLLVEHQFAPELVAQDLVQPVNALLEERGVDFGDGYQRAGLTAFSAQAALQCMPHDVSPTVVYYTPDLVDLGAADPDDEEVLNPVDGWTWEQFAAVARDAARGPGDALHLEPGLAAVAPFVWSAGDEIVDDPGAPTTLMLSEDGRDAVAQVMALVRDPELTPTARELGRAGAVDRFRQGRLAMIVGTRALTPQLRQAAGVEFDVMPLPSLGVVRTLLRPTAYCISARTEATDAAADLVAFAVRRRGASLLARTGHVVPSNVAVANSAAFTQSALPPESAFVFNEGVRRSQAFPFHPAWPELLATTEDDFQRMFQAPVVDLETLLLEIDAASRRVLAAETLATDVPDED